MKHFEWRTVGSLRYAGSDNMTGVQERFFVFAPSQVQLEPSLSLPMTWESPRAILWVSLAEGQWEQDGSKWHLGPLVFTLYRKGRANSRKS